MNCAGDVDAVLTSDSDALVFGALHVIRMSVFQFTSQILSADRKQKASSVGREEQG